MEISKKSDGIANQAGRSGAVQNYFFSAFLLSALGVSFFAVVSDLDSDFVSVFAESPLLEEEELEEAPDFFA